MGATMIENNFLANILEYTEEDNSFIENNRDGISFSIFFDRILKYFEYKIREELHNSFVSSNILFDVDNIVRENSQIIKEEVFSICIRTLIYDINEKRILNLLEGDTAEERYDKYNLSFKEDSFFISFFEKFPVLSSLIEILIVNRITLLNEIILRINNDKVDIEDYFGFKFSRINNIKVTSGDTHNNGKKVSCIITDNKSIIYKPHGLSTDEMFNNIVDYLNSIKALACDIPYLRCIDKEHYGWQEYVTFKSCNNDKEVNNYFYRMGAVLSVLYSIGATDIHFENLICSGENPYIIDFETLVENKSFIKEDLDDLISVFNRDINESVLGTAVLPLNFKNSIFDFDISAMSTSDEQKSDSWEIHTIIENFTDKIRLEKRPGTISKGENQVMVNGEKVEPYLYIEDIIQGFEDLYSIIINNKEEYWKTICNNFVGKDIVVRQVFKPTSIYAKFLEASTHPNYLKDSEDRIKLLNKLKIQRDLLNPKILIQRDEEIKALEAMDIPYFTTTISSRDVIANNSVEIKDFFLKTLDQILKARIEKLNKDDLNTQLRYIRLSLSTTVKNNWNNSAKEVFPRLNERIDYFKNSSNFLDNAKEIGDLLYNTAIWDKKKESCTWLTQLIDGEKLKLGAQNYLLYEGGGIIVFLLQLAKETDEQKYLNLATASLKAIEAQLEKQKLTLDLSAFNGIGSIIYIYYSAFRITNDIKYYNKYKEYIDILFNYNVEVETNIDFVGGISGLIVELVNIYNLEKDIKLQIICSKLGEKLLKLLANEGAIEVAGISHGYSGVALALAKLYEVTKKSIYMEQTNALISKEDEYYSPLINNWRDLRDKEGNSDSVFWCHGAPGILLTRILLSKYDFVNKEIIDNDIHNSIGKIMEDGFDESLDHSLCHGIFGNIDVLINAADKLGDNELFERANKEALAALGVIRENRVICGLNNAFDLLSFMVGLTGIGYVFLRLNNHSIPSILSLDI